jgi:hypothetical protein
MSDTSRQVYFAECIGPLGPIGAIKIGCSYGWSDRLKQISSGLPFTLELRALISGDLVMEKICHLALKEYCISGEYFHPSERVLKVIKRASETGRAFPLIEDLGESSTPEGAVKAFMDFHDVTLAEVCEILGFPASQYERRLANSKYKSRNMVDAAAIVANRREQFVKWPTDALRGLLGEVSPVVERRRAKEAANSNEQNITEPHRANDSWRGKI